MAKPNRLKEISKERQESIETLIITLLNKHGSMEKVASDLGVSFKTIYRFCEDNRIQKVSTYVKVDA